MKGVCVRCQHHKTWHTGKGWACVLRRCECNHFTKDTGMNADELRVHLITDHWMDENEVDRHIATDELYLRGYHDGLHRIHDADDMDIHDKEPEADLRHESEVKGKHLWGSKDGPHFIPGSDEEPAVRVTVQNDLGEKIGEWVTTESGEHRQYVSEEDEGVDRDHNA